MTREEERKPNPLAIGSNNQGADSDQLKAQVMSNRQALLSQLSANQPGVRPEGESEQESVSEAVAAPPPAVESTMGRVVEVIFDTLQASCAEANKALAGSDAQLNCQRPAGIQMRTSPQTGAAVQALRGNVSLPNYSLIVDCTDERILVFIIPSEFLLGFDPESELIAPHLILRQLFQADGQSGWFMDNTPVGNAMLPELSRQLLRNLIAVARGEANPKQPFSYGMTGANSSPQQSPAQPQPSRAAAPVPPGKAGAQASTPPSLPAPAPSQVNYSQGLSRSQTVKQLMVAALDEPRRTPLPFHAVPAPAPEASATALPSNGGAVQGATPSPVAASSSVSPQSVPQAPANDRRREGIRETNEFAMLSELISKEKATPSPQISPVKSASQADEMWQRPESKSPSPPGAPIPPGRARPSSPAPNPSPSPAPVSTPPPPPPPPPAEAGSGNFRVPSDLFESHDSVPQVEPAVSAKNAFPVPPGHMVPTESLPATAPEPEPEPEPAPEVAPEPRPAAAAAADASLSEVSGVQSIPEIPFSLPGPTPVYAPDSAAMVSGPEATSPPIPPSSQPLEPSLSRMDAPLQEKSEGLLSKVIAESAGEAKEAPPPSFKSLKSLISAGDEEEAVPVEPESPSPVAIEAPSSSLQTLLSDSLEDEVLPPPVQPAEASVQNIPGTPEASATVPPGEASGDLGKLVSDTEKYLFEGCDQLMVNLEKALATLKSAGVEAMQDDNIEQVTEIMNHTKRLKALKDKLAALKGEIED
ncbi:hypothetical protein GC174_13630 [bacterium]|nr:hypothetical protein [bacterium]